jgi:hypothetical protein
VFQVESSGMMDALRRMKPTCIEDIVALVALYRPGPMENIPAYCEVKNGLRDLESIHPTIDHILKETQGIIVYQEQVMEIAQVMAGYSPGRRRPAAPRDGQEDRRGNGQGAPEVHRRARRPPTASTRPRRARSSTCWRNSPTTASTSRTPPPMPWSATRPPGSRRTTRSNSWPR